MRYSYSCPFDFDSLEPEFFCLVAEGFCFEDDLDVTEFIQKRLESANNVLIELQKEISFYNSCLSWLSGSKE